ncbi:hypothetical protein [Enhygromyxa salina]|nr:hypothetical protein [Enhygromyxa salina]
MGRAELEAAIDETLTTFDLHTRPLLEVIPGIIKHGYVLIRRPKNKITGIVTKKDLGRQLLDLASPFVLLGEIEHGLRALIENGDMGGSWRACSAR